MWIKNKNLKVQAAFDTQPHAKSKPYCAINNADGNLYFI